MSRIFFLAVLSIAGFVLQSNAQDSRVQGLVKEKSGKPLQSVTVALLKASDSALIKTAVTDSKGNFEINVVQDGSFLLSYTSVGLAQQYSRVFETNGKLFTMADASMEAVSGKLTEVTIVAKKPMIEVKADKTVFNVEASINATGSNALELLQKSPGIQVDNNDNISMKGKTGIRIYVDGKMMQLDTKDLAAYLKSINSNDIEAIEMISNPSAKYDASGNAGIINFRLKKNKKFGTNGSINAGLVQGITPKGNGSVNLNYRDKKVNLFGNVGYNVGRYESEMYFNRIQKDTLYDQQTLMISNDRSVNVKGGADFFINSNHTVGLMATTNFSNSDWTSTGNTKVSYNPTNTFVKNLQAFNAIPGKRTNANFNLNYRYADTSGTEVNFDGDYGIFRGTGNSFQPNYYYADLNNSILLYSVVNRNFTPTDINIYTAKVDVEQKLGKGKLGWGAKTSFVTTKNTFDFFTDTAFNKPAQVLERSNRFKYTENVNAAYVNYQQQLNAKWSMQTGLRAEQTNSEGELSRADGQQQADNTVKRSYLDFFPSAAITWNINQKHALNLTYSRRIDRPTYQDLNPFENKLDELTFQKGNAFLRPQYTNTVELTHTFMGFINTSAGYSNVKDFATEVTDTIGNATFVQQQNLATQQIISFNIGAPTPINKWWNGYANIWFNYQMFNGAIGQNKVNLNIPVYGAYLQQAFTLGRDYTAELSGWFSGPGVWGGTWRTKPQGGVDVGLQKLLFQKKASVKLSVTDIFFTSAWNATNDFGGIYVKGGGKWESRTFRINFNWRFGSSQIKSSRERKTGLDNEARRIKS